MWDNILKHWEDWGHPLRPNKEDVHNISTLLLGENRLLLGATPELMEYAKVYVDKVITGIDWFNIPFKKGSFDSIFGDGCLTLAGPELIPTMLSYLKPGGRLVLRVFLRNTGPRAEHLDIRKFQRWDKVFVPVQEIYDREGSYPTTRDYSGSSDVYFLPDLDMLPTPSVIRIPLYAYGEFYPVIVWTA